MLMFCINIQASLKINSPVADSSDNQRIKRIYQINSIMDNVPKIDGRLDDSCWNAGHWSGGYTQFIPFEGKAPSQQTMLKILHDEENIYVAIRAFDDEPHRIDRQRGRRDDFSGDIVGVCFDSYFDHRTGFEFDLTASGSKIDLIMMNGGWDTSWDAVWEGKVGHEDSSGTIPSVFRILIPGILEGTISTPGSREISISDLLTNGDLYTI